MSAVRISPPKNGQTHDGKVVGKDVVTYTYSQVNVLNSSKGLLTHVMVI